MATLTIYMLKLMKLLNQYRLTLLIGIVFSIFESKIARNWFAMMSFPLREKLYNCWISFNEKSLVKIVILFCFALFFKIGIMILSRINSFLYSLPKSSKTTTYVFEYASRVSLNSLLFLKYKSFNSLILTGVFKKAIGAYFSFAKLWFTIAIAA